MTNLLFRDRLLASTIVASAFFATPAFAQDNPGAVSTAAAAAEEEAPEVIVTGSRIARPDLTSTSPISVVDAQTFQDRGSINVESVLNQLPQVTPGLNANVNNGGNGTATVDIRGLGPSRTLVLMNGRRIVPANNTGVVDINVIPPQLIERVDVVTGGASATYGSDALGGVVNFILKRNFEGVSASGQYNITSRGDSAQFTTAGIIGANLGDGRGNVTVGLSYTDRKASLQSERSYLRIDQNGGSGTVPGGTFVNVGLNPFVPAGTRTFNQNGSVRPFINALAESNGGVGDRYNFAPVNFVQTPQKRFTLNFLGHYEIADGIEAFAEGFYVNSRVDLQLAPTPATNILVNPNSPLLSASARALAAGRPNPAANLVFARRMIEVGPRIQNFDFNDYQAITGLRGDVTDKVKFEVYFNYGRVNSDQTIQNDVSRERLTAGLNGCVTTVIPNCAPVNAFGAGNISPAAVNFIRIASATDVFTFVRKNVVGYLSGDLFSIGEAAPVGFSIGAEYRRDSSSFTPSDASQRGDITGFNAAGPINGSFGVKEVFGEIRFPLLTEQPFAYNLSIGGAGRYSDYTTVGGNATYKAEAEYAPIKEVRFRGTYSRASRAPSVFELFQGGDQSFPGVTDPCRRITSTGAAVPAPSAAVSAICVLQGLPDPRTNATITQINAQSEARLIGNPNLSEEKSDTYTGGVVITPIDNLAISVDYFNIKVDNYISRSFGGANGLIASCFASGTTTAAAYAADPACSLLTRDAAGQLFLRIPLSNNATLKTAGVDFVVGYGFGLDALGLDSSKLDIRSNVTYLDKYTFNGSDFSGVASGDFGTLPHWKANTRVTGTYGPASLSVNWQYIGRSRDTFGDVPEACDVAGACGRIKAQSYFDATVRVEVNETFQVYGGVLNFLDNDPPSVNAGFTATNTDETLYDILGRRFFIGASVKF